ncbi:MAG: hypothetical protein ABJ249_11905, partial [Lentilitoribacter sp.]
KMCFPGGGSFLVLPVANPKASPGTCDSFTLARPCLRCNSILWAWLCAVLQHVSSKSKAHDFFPIIAQRHNIDAGTAFYFIFERQHHRTNFLVANFFFPNHGLVNFLKIYFSPDYDHATSFVFFLRTKTNPFPSLTVGIEIAVEIIRL